jgi:hypothetical protein
MGEGKQEGPGVSPVGKIGIVVVTLYLVGLSTVLLYCLFVLWAPATTSHTAAPEATKEANQRVADTSPTAINPDPGAANLSASRAGASTARVQQPDSSEVTYVIWNRQVGEETRLLLLVVCAGGLGSLVHGLRSIYWYVGNRDLIWSWVPKYLIQPFGASALAVVFYLVIRGGFFSANASSQHTSPFGFTAFSAMVGMFSEQAVLKLKEIAETLLSKPPAGKDSKPESKPGKSDEPPPP